MATLIDLARRIAQDIKPLRYDSGLRDITALAGDKVTSGQILLRRTGKFVTLEMTSVVPSTTIEDGKVAFTLPTGFRRAGTLNVWLTAGASVSRSAYLNASGGFGIWAPQSTDNYRISLTWITNDPIPTTPPGSAA